MPNETIDQKRPVHAENELKKMQQRLVDDTVDDSSPASDPPAGTTSGPKSVAAKSDPDEPTQNSSRGETGTAGPQDPVHRVVDGASRLAQDAYRTGKRYIEEGRRCYPEAERYYQQGRQTILREVQESPLAAVLVAGLVGYVLALLIHGRSGTPVRRSDAPPFGRRPPINEAQRHGMQQDPRERVEATRGRTSATSTSDSF